MSATVTDLDAFDALDAATREMVERVFAQRIADARSDGYDDAEQNAEDAFESGAYSATERLAHSPQPACECQQCYEARVLARFLRNSCSVSRVA